MVTPYMPVSADLKEKNAEDGIRSRLRAWFKVRAIKITDLAETSGIPYRTLQNYLSGTSSIPADALRRICWASGVSADWVLFGQPLLDRAALQDALDVYWDARQLAPSMPAEQAMILLTRQYVRIFWDDFGKARLAAPEILPGGEIDGIAPPPIAKRGG